MSETLELTVEEIRKVRELLEIEAIKKVKLLYSHLMDARDIDALIEIVTEDAICEYGPYGTWKGRQEIHDGWIGVIQSSDIYSIPYSGFHATTNQWVELTSESTAVSRTYLHDIVHEPDPRTNPVTWYGIYDEDYVKVDGDWKIKRCSLQFLWPQRLITGDWPSAFPPGDTRTLSKP